MLSGKPRGCSFAVLYPTLQLTRDGPQDGTSWLSSRQQVEDLSLEICDFQEIFLSQGPFCLGLLIPCAFTVSSIMIFTFNAFPTKYMFSPLYGECFTL